MPQIPFDKLLTFFVLDQKVFARLTKDDLLKTIAFVQMDKSYSTPGITDELLFGQCFLQNPAEWSVLPGISRGQFSAAVITGAASK